MRRNERIILPMLASREACSGCTACQAICPRDAIAMVADEEGFLRPRVDVAKCIGCHRCEHVCSVLHPGQPDVSPTCYAAYTRDEKLRLQSSSGGIFTELAKPIIAAGGVVFGCVWERPELVAIHVRAETLEELAAMRGSKYVQSDLRDTFREAKTALLAGRQVLFSGTPCQIAGLNAFLGKPYDNLLKIEIICHGVPSPVLFRNYKDDVVAWGRRRENNRTAVAFSFRDKSRGWRSRGASVLFDDGRLHREPQSRNGYLKAFLAHWTLRRSCYRCVATDGRSQADITLGDFWGIERVCLGADDNRGISLVIVHTKRGHEAYEGIACSCYYGLVPFQDAVASNPSYRGSRYMNPIRADFMRLLRKQNIDSAYRLMVRERRVRGVFQFVKRCIKRIVGMVLGVYRLPTRSVGIVTIVESYLLMNYGSLFQHYALRMILSEIGFDAFRCANPTETFCLKKDRIIRFVKYRVGLCLARMRILTLRQKVVKSVTSLLFARRNFTAFYRKNVGRLHERSKRCVAYVAGSDQIWTRWTDIVSLANVSDGVVRVSYAASADWYACRNSSEWCTEAKNRLKIFDAISVRERAGQQLLQALLPGKEIFHAIDPVMLLTKSDYEALAPSAVFFKRPTLFVYLVNIRSTEEIYLASYEQLATSLGCQLRMVGIQGAECYLPDQYALYLSPEDFLRAYRDARYVVTNSFHGTVFALLFEKSFLSIKQIDLPKANQNTRQKELLAYFNLGERRISTTQLQIKGEVLLRSTVDWCGIRDAMTEWRLASIDWLRKALERAGMRQS